MAIIMPLFATVVVLYGLIKRVPVFDLFIKGVREGVKVLYTIAPTIIGLVFAVDLLRSSGAIDVICNFISPAANCTNGSLKTCIGQWFNSFVDRFV